MSKSPNKALQKNSILLVEDEIAIASLLKINLELAGFTVSHAPNLRLAHSAIAEKMPNIIILDWALPDGQGISLLQTLRANPQTKNIGIIMLTAKAQEQDKLQGLNAGADDYLTKPFSHNELIARLQALMRRRQPENIMVTHKLADLEIKPDLLEVSYKGKSLTLSSSGFKLLQFFVAHPQRLFTRAQLLDRVWSNHLDIEERTVDVHIKRLRESLQKIDAPNFISTIRGQGYRFDINSATENVDQNVDG